MRITRDSVKSSPGNIWFKELEERAIKYRHGRACPAITSCYADLTVKPDVDARDQPQLHLRYAMRLRIAHTTTYRYEPPATGVIQILRMTPGSHDGQYVADWQIDVSTNPRLDVHQDAFGNVTHVLTHGAIADLTIDVEGLIETHDTGGVLRGTDERFPPSLFLRSTALTEVNPAMATFVRELRSESDSDVLGFLHATDGADQRAHDLR